MTLYFAYGSNLDPRGMANRCPAAVVVGRARLAGWRLAFRGVADVEPRKGAAVEGLLWDCTPGCVRSLDAYEGVSGGFYRKEWLRVETADGPATALVYVMNATRYDRACLPSQGYLDTIVRGYHEFGLPVRSLRAALRRAAQAASEKATRWQDDGRKRLVPVDGPQRPKRRPRRVTEVPPRRPAPAQLDLDAFTNDDLAAMGYTDLAIRELRLERLGYVRGERVA